MNPEDLHEPRVPGIGDDAARLEAVLHEVPRGTVIVAGTAVFLLMVGWFIVYLAIFIPRGTIG